MSFFRKSKCVRCGNKVEEEPEDGLPTCAACKLDIKSKLEIKRQCLIDGSEMKKEIIENIVIDKCPKCNGVWLDSKEIDLICNAIIEEDYSKYVLGLAVGMSTRR